MLEATCHFQSISGLYMKHYSTNEYGTSAIQYYYKRIFAFAPNSNAGQTGKRATVTLNDAH